MQKSVVDQTQASTYLPSVPISVYRQLAAELQATQSQVKSLEEQNQQLREQNIRLQKEAHKVFKSAQQLQQAVSAFGVADEAVVKPSPTSSLEDVEKMLRQTMASKTNHVPVPKEVRQPEPPKRQEPPKRRAPAPDPERIVAEVQAVHYQDSPEFFEEESSGINGWLLAVSVLMIVVMAFGTGFLVVRPLIRGTSSN